MSDDVENCPYCDSEDIDIFGYEHYTKKVIFYCKHCEKHIIIYELDKPFVASIGKEMEAETCPE